MTVGNRIISLLEERNIKQKDLAVYIGVGTSTVNGWREPNRNPSADCILPICEFLGVSVRFLLTGEDSSTDGQNSLIELSETDRALLDLWHKLPPDIQADYLSEFRGVIKGLQRKHA